MMTLHEAILTVIRKNGEPMKPRDIALEINKFSLHKTKSEKPVSANQVWARANNYKNILKITDDKRISEVSFEIAVQDEFIKWVRNFVAHNRGVEFEIIIPYLLFLFRKDDLESNNTVLFDITLESDYVKETLLFTLNKLSNERLPNEFYHIIKSSIDNADPLTLKNLMMGINKFYDFLFRISKEDYQQLFKNIILQLSNVKSKNFEFGTPPSLSKFIRHLVDIKPDQTLCDPFAGFCILLSEVASNSKRVNIYANDLNKRIGVLGLMNLIISGVENIKFTFEDAFVIDDLSIKDWIVSNPPFFKTSFSLSKHKSRYESNVIELLFSKLSGRGRALIIVPDSFLYTDDKNYKYFRRELIKKRAIRSIISLPNGVFLPFTGVAASIIILEKGIKNEEIFFVDLSEFSLDEFEYKSEEFASWYKKRREVDGKSTNVSVELVEEDSSYNLIPRKIILKSIVENLVGSNTIPLKELIKRKIVGKQVSSSNLNEEQDGVPYLRISDLEGIEGVLTDTPKKYISDIELIQPIRYFVEPGTIILARMGNSFRPVIYSYSEAAVPSVHLLCFTINEEVINPLYLLNELNSDFVKQQLDAIQIRGILPNFYKEKDLLDLRIRVPDRKEQLNSIEEPIKGYLEDSGKDSFYNYNYFNLFYIKNDYDHFLPKDYKYKSELSWNNLFILNSKLHKTLKTIKGEEVLSKVVREKEIISSIKHRVSQYLSPINNDIRNFKYFIKDKSISGSAVSVEDKINDLPDASTLTEVFSRIENNLRGISKTFILMNDILYFDKEDGHFINANISDVVRDAKESLKDKLSDVIFVYSVEPEVSDEELIIQIDKDQIEELIRNFIFNSINHGFQGVVQQKIIYIYISKSLNNNYLELNLINNGNPFPEDFTKEDFISFGRKGVESNGTGIGGYLMNKIVENHEGKFEWYCNQNFRFEVNAESQNELEIIATVYFKISLPYITN